jgi:DNA recombination protein RmuC
MWTIIVGIFSAVLVAVISYIAIRRGQNTSATTEFESRITGRFDQILESVGRWRDESRSVVQDKIGELYQRGEDQNRLARGETQQTLDQFRATLEGYRDSLAKELDQNRRDSREVLEQMTRLLAERFEKLQESNEKKLAEIRAEVEKKLDETLQKNHQTFQSVLGHLSELHLTNQRIVEFTRDLHELQNILKAPKLRGELGEAEMERMLRDCLTPEQFDTQHEIDGNRVDAVILNPTGELPIDSKFPLESWRRIHNADASDAEKQTARKEFIKAVKKHIDDIAMKYIRPPQTLEFAVMYIPSEGVYYELMELADLTEYARLKRVFPASPMTFWALLQVTIIGFRGLRISEQAQRISGLLTALGDDFAKMREAFILASKQLNNAKSNMDNAAGHMDRFSVKLDNIHAAPLPNSTQQDLLKGDSE